ncbi:MAG: 1-phosphofructokinase [Clostridia bacterium]|nr:1-phosphofructokinase [Clostridia bacterium]
MIYTLTMSPAIDYVMDTPSIKVGAVNRSSGERIFYGGKGINVSWVLASLGIRSTALGFIAGFTGAELERGLTRQGIKCDFCTLSSGATRINVKLKSSDVTEINGAGPSIGDGDIACLLAKLDLLTEGDFLVIAGSIPPTLPRDTYETLLQHLDGRGIKFVVDATGELLLKTLKYRPYLIKPNYDELCEIMGKPSLTDDEVQDGAVMLQNAGARNVMITLGGKGAVLLDENGVFHKRDAFNIVPVNTVGAGDSTIAGFLAKAVGGCADFDEILRFACAAGAATASAEGLATAEMVERVLGR